MTKAKEEQKIYFEILKDFEETYIKHPENFSINENDVCMYRGDNGKKCAVGKYIPDSLYTPNFEEKGVSEIFDKIKEALPVDNLKFWQDLQELHDIAAFDTAYRTSIIYAVEKYCPSYKDEFTY